MKLKWLLPLFLLIMPVAGEMVINPSGLITPWPILLINLFISAVCLLISQKKELSPISIFVTLLRTLAALGGSWNSLRLHGISGFDYPERAMLIPLINLLPTIFSEEILLCSISWVILIFSWIWQIFAMSVYLSKKNFSVSAQFITNCTNETSKIAEGYFLNCVEENLCYITNGQFYFMYLLVNIALVIYTPFVIWTLYSIKKYKKIQGYIISGFFGLVLFLLLMLSAGIQTQTLSTVGLENCDINYELLSSKTGYLNEWLTQKPVFKQFALP